MSNELTVIKNQEGLEIRANKWDVIAVLAKGVIGAAPVVGSILAETIATVIPNQKLDRVIKFIEILDGKIRLIEGDIEKLKMDGPEFADLLEDSLNQATRALSDERKEYIASLLKNSMTIDDLEHIEKKKLFSILQDINDAEILILKSYSLFPSDKRQFVAQHKELFSSPIGLSIGAPQEQVDKGAIRESYRNKLVELSLLSPNFQKPKKGEFPEFDEKKGTIKVATYKITTLGKLFLKYIDLY